MERLTLSPESISQLKCASHSMGCFFIYLKEIDRLRTTREELGRLLGNGKRGGGGMSDDSDDIFQPFREVSALR